MACMQVYHVCLFLFLRVALEELFLPHQIKQNVKNLWSKRNRATYPVNKQSYGSSVKINIYCNTYKLYSIYLVYEFGLRSPVTQTKYK